MNINEINTEIHRLEKERTRLINEQNRFKEETIKSLDWTKECDATLNINPLGGAASISKYNIILRGSRIPSSLDQICLMGNNPISSFNILYGKSGYGTWGGWEDPCQQIHTNNLDLLIDFLKQVKFKSFSYDKDMLRLLKVAEEVSQS